MDSPDLDLKICWHAPDGSVHAWWDPAVPLPAELSNLLRQRFPEPLAQPELAEQDRPASAPPAWFGALAPDLAVCFLEYADGCRARDDLAGLRSLVPHFAALVRNTETLARSNAGEQLIPLTHQLRGGWVRLLYEAGRYAEGWVQSAGLPNALAAHATIAERRAAWVFHGLLALETGHYAEAGEALAEAEGLGTAGAPRDVVGWLLALGQADLAAACDHDQPALAAYAALDDPAAPGWVRVRILIGQARIWTRLAQAVAGPLIEAARDIDGGGWSVGLADIAVAELELMYGRPGAAAGHAVAARAACAAALGEEYPATAAAILAEAQASYMGGAYAEAARLGADALARLQAAHGPNHPLVVQAFGLQGLLAGARGDAHQLVRDLTAAVRSARQLAEASDTAEISADLLECTIALAQGRAGRARAAAGRALEYARVVLDALHPLTAACLDAVAECERLLGRWSVARVYGDMALGLRTSLLGAEHPLVATSWEQLGLIALDSRAYNAARDAFELAVRVRRATLGTAHPLTATAQLSLARAAVGLGDLAGAESAAAAALGGFERTYGSLHPSTRTARALLSQFSSPLCRNWWRARARLRRLHSVA